MSQVILTSEPESFFAGDSVTWKISLADYSAADYTLTYVMVKSGKQITFSSTASGSDFLISITTTASALYTVGVYDYIGYLTKTGERITVRSGQIEIKTNFATQTGGFDARSTVQIIYEAIEATILGKASSDQLSRKVGDRELRYMSPQQLTDWRDFYYQEYQRELGKAGKRIIIKTQFTEE